MDNIAMQEKQKQDRIDAIYNILQDKKSKDLYKSLMDLQESHDLDFLIKAVEISGYDFDCGLVQYQKNISERRPLVLYGMGKIAASCFKMAQEKKGKMGYLFYPFITDIPWSAYCDKNLAWTVFGSGVHKKIVLSPQELREKLPDAIIYVTTPDFYEEIKDELSNLGYAKNDIRLYVPAGTKVYEDEQYFDHEIFEPRKEEYFIDGGCYRLDTVERFCHWNRGYGFKGFISFEPDPKNYEICIGKIAALNIDDGVKSNSCIVNAGLSDQCEEKYFMCHGNDESCFDEEGNAKVSLTTIDSTVEDRPVSFIKLDVEGFELAALKGAEKTIRKYKPRIAVCLYHKPEDLIDIPEYLMQLNLGYNFYLRMYSDEYLEITLYAVAD